MTSLQMRWTIDQDTTRHRLKLAIRNEQTICFRYTKQDEKDWENRSVSPYEIQDTGTGPILLTWDHERQDIRSFRLDGIEAITTCPWYEYREPQS